MTGRSSKVSALAGWVDIEPGEGRVLAWSFLYVFALFVAYYVLRPIRDELGVAGGVRNLPWLFTGTLVTMLVLSPLFGWLVRRWPRRRFIALVNRFFILDLLLFAVGLSVMEPGQMVWVGRAFFIWVSVFNLFVVSVFWSLMVDVFDVGQGKRLFGVLAAGATAGGMLGSALISLGVEAVNPYWLLLMAAVLLEVAVQASRRVLHLHTRQTQAERSARASVSSFHESEKGAHENVSNARIQAQRHTLKNGQPSDGRHRNGAWPSEGRSAESDERGAGGSVWAGLTHTLRSPYLLGISAYILLYTVTSTYLYFQQAEIAEGYFASRAERTAFFARIDLWVNGLTLLFQLFITARLTRSLGIIIVLSMLPVISVIGFASLGLWASVWLFVAVQVVRRVSNFAFAKPTREILFTAVPSEDRYKAKNFIDTVIYRSGDQIGSWSYAALGALGFGMTGISLLTVPLCVLWVALSIWLGRKQQRLNAMQG
ncbi:MAG: hypothetical protein Q4A16_10780 [Lautropia sp.]|nr:hypothetical protein [Lautropia sp.]